MSNPQDRLRTHPAERFSGDSHIFNLQQALNELRNEQHPAQQGHRQVTIFHRAPVTQVLFSFEPGGELADHAANGLVTIHALEGVLTVQVAAETHELQSGSLLVLSPGVRHSVRAAQDSAMLLTVHMQKADA